MIAASIVLFVIVPLRLISVRSSQTEWSNYTMPSVSNLYFWQPCASPDSCEKGLLNG